MVSLNVIQTWAKQLLSGLEYLHTRNPVILHRDIKSNNIFMDATSESNSLKIGDLGLATLYTGNMRAQMTIIGTPEYMAPEYYSETYNELVDIWAFGLVILEMVTGKVPYCECGGAVAQIFTKVSRGVLPSSLDDMRASCVKDFILQCLLPKAERPSAAVLLQHEFITLKHEGNTDTVYAMGEGSSVSPSTSRHIDPSPPAPKVVAVSLKSLEELAIREEQQQQQQQQPQHSGDLPQVVQQPPPPQQQQQQHQVQQQPVMDTASSPGSNGSPVRSPALPALSSIARSVSASPLPDTLSRSSSPLTTRSEPPSVPDSPGGAPFEMKVLSVTGDSLHLVLHTTKVVAGEGKEMVETTKDVEFNFDVSCDHVEDDAHALASMLSPEYELDPNLLTEHLSRCVANNMHLTSSGKRLRLLSPILPQATISPEKPLMVRQRTQESLAGLVAAQKGAPGYAFAVPSSGSNTAFSGTSNSSVVVPTSAPLAPIMEADPQRTTPDIELEQRRKEMLERFQKEAKDNGEQHQFPRSFEK